MSFKLPTFRYAQIDLPRTVTVAFPPSAWPKSKLPAQWFGACIHRSDEFMLRKAVTVKFLRQHTVDKDDDTVGNCRRLSWVA